MRTWGGATTTPRDLRTPSLNIGAGSFSRDDDSVPEPLLIASGAGTETLAAIHHVEASSAR